ncbi:hypothetical protein HELRODRAFT_64039, partial [Helobdella robusta]|uniref:HAT C-terminal dimerisation domain-containing protein n=1 Tax=Helobdella robusta TaxID=6412 RepID=T1FXN6_HELRO
PKTAIEALAESNFSLFPNIQAPLSIMAILPVPTSTVERNFSTLKRIKNY